jgi:hypothetical protein
LGCLRASADRNRVRTIRISPPGWREDRTPRTGALVVGVGRGASPGTESSATSWAILVKY